MNLLPHTGLTGEATTTDQVPSYLEIRFLNLSDRHGAVDMSLESSPPCRAFDRHCCSTIPDNSSRQVPVARCALLSRTGTPLLPYHPVPHSVTSRLDALCDRAKHSTVVVTLLYPLRILVSLGDDSCVDCTNRIRFYFQPLLIIAFFLHHPFCATAVSSVCLMLHSYKSFGLSG